MNIKKLVEYLETTIKNLQEYEYMTRDLEEKQRIEVNYATNHEEKMMLVRKRIKTSEKCIINKAKRKTIQQILHYIKTNK